MTFTIHDCEQRSDAWFACRTGRLTGSVADILYKSGRKKGEESVQRRDLRLKLACEQLTGLSLEDDFQKPDYMQRGIEKEDDAFAAFEARTGLVASRSGFLAADDLMVGCSLDGHVGQFEAILEVKCPKTFTHIKYLDAGVLPPEYQYQVVHNLWVSGAQRAHFLSFDDRLPDDLSVFHVVVERDEELIQAHAARAVAFLAEVAEEVKRLEGMRGKG